MTAPPVSRTVHPRSDLVTAYNEAYARYSALYPSMKVLMT